MTFDHIVPRSKGGTNAPANRAPVCLVCNSSKRDSLLVDWVARLRSRPSVDTGWQERVLWRLLCPLSLMVQP